MSDAPFFEPLPEPEEPFVEEDQVVDLPWMPPSHIAGVFVPLDADVFRGDDVVVRVTHAVCYRRGLEVHIGSWVRPSSRRPPSAGHSRWGFEDPRVGIRLADGTRLGHQSPHGPMADDITEAPDADEAPATLTPLGGGSEAMRTSSQWWLHPLPEGDTIELVVQWEPEGVPESAAVLDLALLREAAEHEDVLWDPPPPPGDGAHGWFAYAPLGGSVYRSGQKMNAEAEEGDDGVSR